MRLLQVATLIFVAHTAQASISYFGPRLCEFQVSPHLHSEGRVSLREFNDHLPYLDADTVVVISPVGQLSPVWFATRQGVFEINGEALALDRKKSRLFLRARNVTQFFMGQAFATDLSATWFHFAEKSLTNRAGRFMAQLIDQNKKSARACRITGSFSEKFLDCLEAGVTRTLYSNPSRDEARNVYTKKSLAIPAVAVGSFLLHAYYTVLFDPHPALAASAITGLAAFISIMKNVRALTRTAIAQKNPELREAPFLLPTTHAGQAAYSPWLGALSLDSYLSLSEKASPQRVMDEWRRRRRENAGELHFRPVPGRPTLVELQYERTLPLGRLLNVDRLVLQSDEDVRISLPLQEGVNDYRDLRQGASFVLKIDEDAQTAVVGGWKVLRRDELKTPSAEWSLRLYRGKDSFPLEEEGVVVSGLEDLED